MRSFEVDKDAVRKATLTSGFFASKTLGLDLDPMEAKSRYGMRDEQEKTFMLQKGPLGEDRLRVCTESSKHGRMFICFVALILAWRRTSMFVVSLVSCAIVYILELFM